MDFLRHFESRNHIGVVILIAGGFDHINGVFPNGTEIQRIQGIW